MGDDVDRLADLEPAEEHVKVRCSLPEPPPPPVPGHLPEPSEEQEEVALTDPLIRQVNLGRVDLAERRSPALVSWHGPGGEIRIEMSLPLWRNLASGQVLHELPNVLTRRGEFPIAHQAA